MAQEVLFNGKLISLPGSYATIKGTGLTETPITNDRVVLVIDSGTGAGYGSGAGVDGQSANGSDAIYEFTDMSTFQNFVGGGVWYQLAKPLFQPVKSLGGVNKLYYMRAATTAPGKMELTFTNGSIILGTTSEGTGVNGVLDDNKKLTTGLGATMSIGQVDDTKFIFRFYKGSYTGTAPDGLPYGDVSETLANPLLVAVSPEVGTITELVTWMKKNSNFLSYFTVTSSNVSTEPGTIVEDDLTAWTTAVYQVVTGGTETYSLDNFKKALQATQNLYYSFFLSDNYADGWGSTDKQSHSAMGSYNSAVQYAINNDTRFEHVLVIGGGNTTQELQSISFAAAKYYDDESVVVVHGAPKVISNSQERTMNSLYKAALVVGRMCSVEPEVPMTFKSVDISGEVAPLGEEDMKNCLKNGVVGTYFDSDIQKFVILQGVTTLQDNGELWNADGKASSIAIKRGKMFINATLMINSKKQLLVTENGPTRSSITDAYLKDWTIGQLQNMTATETQGGVIFEFDQNTVSVTRDGDSKFVQYGYYPNSEVNKLFFTGFILK